MEISPCAGTESKDSTKAGEGESKEAQTKVQANSQINANQIKVAVDITQYRNSAKNITL